MTDQTHTDASTEGQQAEGDLFNTAAGWVLIAAILGLGLSILSGKYFHASKPERPEQLGYVIEGVEDTSGPGPIEMSFAEALSLATVEQGEKIYAKCAACHTITPGGANGQGPNLNKVMGAQVASRAGYSYSGALAGKGGTWGWEEMNLWLKKPSSYVEGTKMAFAGLRKIEDRAAVALFMNGPDGTLPLPEFTPAAETEALEEEADAAAVEQAEAAQDDAEATSEATAEAEA
ncbi:MAG: c-type cytochrome [Pseudomonadota bacterium]